MTSEAASVGSPSGVSSVRRAKACAPSSRMASGASARCAPRWPAMAGMGNRERVRRWFQDKKAGWYAVLEVPQMAVTSTLLDQAHNAIDRQLFMMQAFH